MNIDTHMMNKLIAHELQIDAEAALDAAPVTTQEIVDALTNCAGAQFEQFCAIVGKSFDAEVRHFVELLVMQERDK